MNYRYEVDLGSLVGPHEYSVNSQMLPLKVGLNPDIGISKVDVKFDGERDSWIDFHGAWYNKDGVLVKELGKKPVRCSGTVNVMTFDTPERVEMMLASFLLWIEFQRGTGLTPVGNPVPNLVAVVIETAAVPMKQRSIVVLPKEC